MAQYMEKVYADDCFVRDRRTGKESRGDTVRAEVNVAGQYDNGGVRDTADTYIVMHFPPPSSYPKKRIASCRVFYRATSRNGWFSGTVGPTSYPKYILEGHYNSGWKGHLYADESGEDIYSVPTNQYHELSTFVDYDKTEAFGYISLGIGVVNGYYSNVYYTGGVTLSIIATGDNRPYAIYTMEDLVPYVLNAYPQSGFVNERAPSTFGWEFGCSNANIGAPLKQASAKFRWRAKGATAYTEIAVAGAANSITIPANTFKTAQVEWQVVVVSDDGIASQPSNWYTLTTVDSVPGKPIPKSPVSVLRDGAEPIEMEWAHVIDTGSPQSRADLQYYTAATGEWQTLTTVTGPAIKTTMPANTFPPGQIRWRVRTYNTDNVAGDWSEPASFVSVRAPDAPAITAITQCARPTVSWQAVGQIAYQLQIGGYDTGEVAGTEKLFKAKDYLPNGTYQVRLRIKGESSLWSAWAAAALTLDVSGPPAPMVAANALQGAAVIDFASDAARLYLLRDGVPIADVTGLTSYRDNGALGEVVYTVRAVDDSDNYTDSQGAAVTVTVPHAMLAAADDLLSPVPLRFTRGGPRQITGSIGQAVAYHYYAGRELPVATYAGQRTESYQLDVAFRRADGYDKKRLLALINSRKTLLYRDRWGNRWHVVVGDVGYEQDHISTTLSLTMTRVDYVEAINYAEV